MCLIFLEIFPGYFIIQLESIFFSDMTRQEVYMISFLVFQTRYGWVAISSTSKGLCFLVLPEADDVSAKQKITHILDIKYGKKINSEKIIYRAEYYSDSEGQYFLKKSERRTDRLF